jgi:hypothetical protein
MWGIYDYIDGRGRNDIAEWTRQLQKPERIKLRSKLDMLAIAGGDLPPDLLMKTEVPYIYKLKVQGNPKLRPMICRQHLKFAEKDLRFGNQDSLVKIDEEVYVVLIGAKEISWEYEPAGADIDAGHRRIAVIANPQQRLCRHERIDR